MYVAVTEGSIQGKSRFTVPQGELRYFTAPEGGTFVSDKSSFRR